MRALPDPDETPFDTYDDANNFFRVRLKRARVEYANLLHAFNGEPVSHLYEFGGKLNIHQVERIENNAFKIVQRACKYHGECHLLLDIFERGIK